MGKLRLLLTGTCLCWGMLFGSAFVGAQDSERQLPPDVRVIIDISGSMKQNDPSNLRQPALELLVKLLPEGSKAGVWTFGKNINMLIPHRPVTDRWRADATAEASKINSVGLFTNIGEALEKAGYDVGRPSDKYRTSLILLTDGLVDISREPEDNQAEWRRIIDEVLPKFEKAGYTIHTIALSDNADAELMNKLALNTDGIGAVAKSAEELMKIFLKAFDQAAPAEQVPLEENKFVIDSSVEEFTALIFRKPGSEETQLIGPDRSRYSFNKEERYVSWYRTDAYDLITLQRPLEGEWKVKADLDPDSRVTVVSNLNLLVKPLKTNLFGGEQLDVSMLLQEDGKTITRAQFLRLLDVDSEIVQTETSESWQQSLSDGLPPGDGIFKTTYKVFEQEGVYDLRLLVDGKSFKREFSHTLSVRQPFGVKLENDTNNGKTEYVLTVSSFSRGIDAKQTKVVARVKDPRGRSTIKPLSLTEVDNWQLALTPEHDGEYLINLRVNAVDESGKEFEFVPEPVRFRYPDVNDPFAAVVAEPALEVMPEPEPGPEPVVEKPEPKPALKTEQKPAPKPAPEPERKPELAEEGISKWVLYTGLGVGNLLIIALAFFAYRTIMGTKEGDSLKELEEAMEETAASADEPPEEPAAEPELVDAEPEELEPEALTLEESNSEEAEPAMDDLMLMDDLLVLDETMIVEDPTAEPEADEQLANSLMGSDLDLSADSMADADLAADDLLLGDDDFGDVGGDDPMGSEFSLDDFAPDEIEEKS